MLVLHGSSHTGESGFQLGEAVMWRAVVCGVMIFCGVVGSQSTVQAHGALALGIPADIGQSGVAVGYAANSPTPERAMERAMARCRDEKNAPADTRALCKVYARFSHRCFAIALDPENGTPGFGWAVEATLEVARANAVGECRRVSSEDRKPHCNVAAEYCDESP